ncbi:MAG: thioesterase family protein [Burkholderiales bacterium]
MTSARQLVHISRFELRFADMDALGHVNNAAYFTFMEQARIEWLDRNAPGAYAKGVGPLIANASCTYRTPLVYPKAIEVRMYLGVPGRSSIDSHYEIVADGMVYADGAAKIVWVDLATGKSTPLPEDIAAPLRALRKEAT